MRLTCSRQALANAFQAVNTVVPTRTPRPVLQNVRLGGRDKEVILAATDGETGIRYTVADVELHGQGEVLLPANHVIAILRELRDETIRLEASADRIEIRTDNAEFELPAIDPAEFPTVPMFEDRSYFTIAARMLREMIRRTIFAIDPDSSRFALGGILVDASPERIHFVATDTRRLAIATAASGVIGTPETRATPPVVPSKAMALLERILSDDDTPVSYAVHANGVVFDGGNWTVSSRLVEGRFPNYRDVVPKEGKAQIELLVNPFYGVIRQAQIATDAESRGVDFHFEKGRLTLSSQSPKVGRSRVSLPIAYEGGEILATFDPRFIADFLKVLPPEMQVRFDLTDGDSAAKLSTNDGYVYVVMPLARDR